MLVKDRKLLPNAAKPTLYFAEPAIPLEFEFDFDLPTGTTYTLAVDVERKRIITGPMASTVGAVSGKKLTFALNTLTDRFDTMSQTNADAFIEIYDATNKVYLQDRLPIAPRVDVDGVPPQQLAKYPTVTAMNEAIAAAETAFLANSNTFTGTITVQRSISSLLTVKSTLETGRTGIDYVGTGRSFWAGVGNAEDTIEALRNCWGVYDVTATAPRMTISPAGVLWAADISINGTPSLSAKLAELDSRTAVCPDQTVFVLSGGIPYRAAAVMSGGVMSAGMSQYVHSGGSAVSAAILGGSQMITSGGHATGSIVAGGVMLVSTGGSALTPAIGPLGVARLSGGYCSAATMTDGSLLVSSGGVAIATAATGGTLYVSAGGSATGGTIAGSGGLAMNGGSVAQMTLNNTATNIMSAGAVMTSMTFQSGAVGMTSATCYNARVVGPNVYINAGATDNDTIVSSGTLWTQLGGSSVRTVISSGGVQRVAGVATDAVISSGGTLVVLNGGSALNVTSAPGATVAVSAGGTITYKP